jgi:hypothetical protein
MEGWINGVLKKHTGSNAPLFHCSISYRRVSLAMRLHVKRRNPRDQRRNFKNSLRNVE